VTVPYLIGGDEVFQAPRRTTAAIFSWISTLDGDRYRLSMRWNDRTRCWALSIETYAGDPIVDGVQMGAGFNLIGDVVADGMPPGQIFVVDTTRANADPVRTSFQSSHVVAYRPAAVVATATGSDVVR
jgi:hypothetical protein